MVLPVTIPGTLYGQDVRLAALDIYWQGATTWTPWWICACGGRPAPAGTATWRYSTTRQITPVTTMITPTAAEHYDLSANNVLSPDSGIIYLMVASPQRIEHGDPPGRARLTLEYDN